MQTGSHVLWSNYPGIVFRIINVRDDGGLADVHMVGDDRVFNVEVSELILYDGEVCSCGQLGCGYAVYEIYEPER